MAWLWSDTLADLLETIDRVEPEALQRLRMHPIAYRLGDDDDPVSLARSVYHEAAAVSSPRRSLRADSAHSPSSRPA